MKTATLTTVIVITFCRVVSAYESEVSWIQGESPPDFSIGIDSDDPHTVNFSVPTDVFPNRWAAEFNLGGTPTLSVDPANRKIELTIQGPPPDGPIPPLWDPVCGLEGHVGSLEEGTWAFHCHFPGTVIWWSLTICPPTNHPDLYDKGDSYRSFSPQSVAKGEVFHISCELGNKGQVDSGAFRVTFYSIDNASAHLIGDVSMPGIPVNDSVSCNWDGVFPDIPAGLYDIGWTIDADDEVQEQDEDNNTAYKEGYRLTVRLIQQRDYLAEQFSSDGDLFDLSNTSIMFAPDEDGTSYSACTQEIGQLPTDPAGGTELVLGDDSYQHVSLTGQTAVTIFGSAFSSFYVSSNGYITFTKGDRRRSESLFHHFATSRISALFDDLDPSWGGVVSSKQLADRVAVTWEDVPEFGTNNFNTFQVEMYFDGRICLSWLTIAAQDGIVGLSHGLGLPGDFSETNLSEYPPWPSQDIGSGGAVGNTRYDRATETWTIQGNGHGILSNSDSFRYAYQQLSGDGVITARVAGINTGSNAWCKAGAMIRETLTDSSKHATTVVTGGNGGAAFQWRLNTGGDLSSTHEPSPTVSLPYWIRIVREGDSFTGYLSPDGNDWSQQGDAVTIDMARDVYFGLCVTSHVAGELCSATFDNVYLGPIKWATGPSPADGALLGNTWAALGWLPGAFAISHGVYIGENFGDVEAGTADTFQGNQGSTFFIVGFPGFPYPGGLVPGTTYYWRIDQFDGATTCKGDVWSFTVASRTAFSPHPPDGAEFVNTQANLSWDPGLGAFMHFVYFGESFDDVAAGTAGTYKGIAPGPNYAPGMLAFETVYYWRVDEFTGSVTHQGDVWSFTTAPAEAN